MAEPHLEQPIDDDPTFWYGTHIQFAMTGRSPSGKTMVWVVQARAGRVGDEARIGGNYLGYVRWFARWRKYSFYPEPNCVFEDLCLREIAMFIEARTFEHKMDTKRTWPAGTPGPGRG